MHFPVSGQIGCDSRSPREVRPVTDFRLRGGGRVPGSGRDGRDGRQAGIGGGVELDPETTREGAPGSLRIVVADQHPMLRVAVTTALNEEAGFEVVGEAALCDPLLA